MSRDPAPELGPAERLRIALDLHQAGVELQRQNLARRYPGASREDIEARLLTWLRHRPGAEWGDYTIDTTETSGEPEG
ncbi:MAG: hypothetical protein R3234_11460 [Thermoanaerobaculia bacterium]|nr:hypothetical protein [Thermoanaerobaculia bacterium]